MRYTNKTRTAKYTWYTWAPLSLLFQFTRVANIYFLFISILTCMSFSPKSPGSMIGTFSAVLIFTMFKELFEDIFRMISDYKINNTKATRLNQNSEKIEDITWKDIKVGDIIQIHKDEAFPCDMLFVYSKSDVIFVDTMNLDGETNLKPKTIVSKELFDDIKNKNNANIEEIEEIDNSKLALSEVSGKITCEPPSENLESWDGNFEIINTKDNFKANCHGDINSLLLRGCYLRNTEFCYGIAVYLGQRTKIMMNAKKPRRKVSNLMKLMNYMLYTVFGLQIGIIILFATLSCIWINNKGSKYDYLNIGSGNADFGKWIIQLFTYWVAYSHMIPISLYVMIEVLKLVQASLIKWDDEIGKEDSEFKPAECKNSDLIEELGQVDFIFSDKTGTLTRNQMVFKCCSVNGDIYKDEEEEMKVEDIISSERQNQSKHKVYENKKDTWRGAVIGRKTADNHAYQFFKHMTICHSVMVDKDSKKNKISEEGKQKSDDKIVEEEFVYQCSSPDELALIDAATEVGIVLVDRTKEYVIIRDDNEERKYRMHAEFTFDSKRKRMSVIVEEDKEYYIYTKGADNEMIKKIEFEGNHCDTLKEHLHHFAIKGLRTLVMAKRKISVSEFNDIISKLEQIKSSDKANKEEDFDALYEKYEDKLKFVGASAIEDLLQDEVPETIEKLMEANIRVWVLTGDKQETAIEIAKSCRLIQEGMDTLILSIDMKALENLKGLEAEELNRRRKIYEDGFKLQLSDKINGYIKNYLDDQKEIENPDIIFKKDLKDLKIKPITIVIDGLTLALILGDPTLEKMFLSLGFYSKSVVCCRVTPKQKSVVVGLAKKYKNSCIRLSVGDGANDVPMILEANIGVGIRGKEGTQAVRSADYAISQFKYLQKLLLFHGRLGYRRVSWMVCYYFYKNVVLVFTEIYFAFYNGYSGQIFFADWLPMLYNSLWTSLTCLFAYALERDVSYKVTVNNPKLYEAGQKKEFFSFKTFWKWIFLSIFHGATIFFGCSYGFRGVIDSSGKTEDMWFASTTAFSCIIHLVTIKLGIELIFINWIVIAAGIGSVIFYWLFVIIFNTSSISQLFQPELEYVYFRMFSNGKFWIVLFCLPMIALIPDITLKYFNQMYNPSVSDKVIAAQSKLGSKNQISQNSKQISQ